MSASDLFVILIVNFIRIYINYKYLTMIFNKNGILKFRIILSILFCFTITSGCYLLFNNPNVNIITNMIGLFVIAYFFKGDIKKKLLATILIYSINMICDIVVVLSFTNYGVQVIEPMLGSITMLALMICQIVMEILVKTKKEPFFISPHWKVLIFVPIISIAMLHHLILTSLLARSTIILEGLCLLIINLIIFYLYGAMESVYQENIDKEIFKQQAKVYLNQLEIIQETQEQVHSLRHDMKHHVRELLALASEQRLKELKTYLVKMGDSINNPEEFVYSDNKELDGNLNYLLKKANNYLNDVNIDVKIPKGISEYSFDLNVVLGNLIDNAIEAARETQEKKLSIFMGMQKDVLLITVINSYDGKVRKKGSNFISRKKNSNEHGFGLKNVKWITCKYNGSMEVSYEEKEFRVDILLYISALQS